MWRRFKAWLEARQERRLHNDRDYACRYWWGDRGGYDLRDQRCRICNPEPFAIDEVTGAAVCPVCGQMQGHVGH